MVFLLQKGTKWHPFEQIIHLLEDTVRVVDILVEPLSALLTESQILVDIPILVVTSQKEYLARIFQF